MLQAVLKVVGGKQDGSLIPLTTKKFLIGREQDCHLRPGSESVSRHHCAISVDEYGVRVRDLGSSNGTLINDKRIIGVQEIHTGDRLKIGSLEFEMLVSSEGVPVGAPSGSEFSLNEFELDEVNDTAVMSGDTAVIDKTKLEEQRAEQAAAEASEGGLAEPEAPAAEAAPAEVPAAVAPPAEAQPVAEAPPQPQTDPNQQAAPPQPAMPPQQPPMPQPGMPPQPGMAQPGMAYPPQYVPGYPGMPQPGMPQPGYPYGMPAQPGYGMPPQPQYGVPYPQQPGYPPQQPMPYPAQPAPAPAPEPYDAEEYDDEYDDDEGEEPDVPPVSLPDPSETGLKEEPKSDDGDKPASAPPPNPAEEVLKKYTNRR